MGIHIGVRLGKAVFDMFKLVGFSVGGQLFNNKVFTKDDLLFAGTADNADLKLFIQFGTQCFGLRLPFVI